MATKEYRDSAEAREEAEAHMRGVFRVGDNLRSGVRARPAEAKLINPDMEYADELRSQNGKWRLWIGPRAQVRTEFLRENEAGREWTDAEVVSGSWLDRLKILAVNQTLNTELRLDPAGFGYLQWMDWTPSSDLTTPVIWGNGRFGNGTSRNENHVLRLWDDGKIGIIHYDKNTNRETGVEPVAQLGYVSSGEGVVAGQLYRSTGGPIDPNKVWRVSTTGPGLWVRQHIEDEQALKEWAEEWNINGGLRTVPVTITELEPRLLLQLPIGNPVRRLPAVMTNRSSTPIQLHNGETWSCSQDQSNYWIITRGQRRVVREATAAPPLRGFILDCRELYALDIMPG